MTRIETILYTGKTHTTGGRDGATHSSDRRLDVKLSPPGSTGDGTNPEQLFAAGWSACFIGAMGLAARKMKITLPPDLAVDAEVDLGTAAGNILPPGPPQCQPAGPGARCRPGAGGCGAPDLPVFQGHPRQHRRRDQSGLSASGPPGGRPRFPLERAAECPKRSITSVAGCSASPP